MPAKKSGRSSDDDDDADVDVDDDWEKSEEDDSWDPDFQEFDIPKSKSSKSGEPEIQREARMSWC